MIVYKNELNTKYNLTTLKLGIPEDYKKRCIEEIYNLGDSMDNTTNVKGTMTSYAIWKESRVFDRLLDNIVEIILTTRDKIFRNQWDLKLSNAWGAIYKKDNYAQPHTHYPSTISFVYYLQTTPNTPIIFSDSNFVLHPEDDTLVIFPSFVLHEVPMHQDKKDRVVIAGNMDLYPKDN